MNRKSFALFYVLTFLLLGLIPLLAAIFNNGSMDFDQAAQRASDETGLAWTSNLLVVIRLSFSEPILLLTVLGSAIPSLAAIIMLIKGRDWGLWKAFWHRMNPISGMSTNKAMLTYAQIFIVIIVGLLVTLWFRKSTGGHYEWGFDGLSFGLLSAVFVAAFLDQGAILEELGWRAYATPLLQDGGMNPLKTAILIGICWGLWHLPRDITTGVIDRLGLWEYAFLYLPSFLLGTISVSIVASFFMNKMNGSVIPAIVVHGLTNDSMGLSGHVSIVEALTPYHQITKAVPFAILAIVFVLASGSMLNFRPDEEGSAS